MIAKNNKNKFIKKQINNKSLTEKILLKDENNICIIIKLFEKEIYSIFTNILLILKDNKHIYHIDNYIQYNYIDKYIENDIPLMILLGGSAYKMYSIFYNNYFRKDVIKLNNHLIESIDYDFSIIVNKSFNINIFKEIINLINGNNINIINNINNNQELQDINIDDIKIDIFLQNKKILKISDKIKKILLTYNTGKEYYSFQINIKYNSKIYQILELLFWRDGIISNSIYIIDFEINKCVLFQTNEFKILLPDIAMLVKTNIISLKSRLQNNNFNKCTKDYYRLKFIELINKINNDNIDDIDDPVIKSSMIKINQIYNKENSEIFKLPYSICSLHNDDIDKKNIYDLYNKFLNLELSQQVDILLNNKYINVKNKKIYKNIFNKH